MPVPILAARYLHKTYGRGPTRFDTRRGVSLDIDEGDSVPVVGKSGSGKSPLMHLLALLDKPSDGSVEGPMVPWLSELFAQNRALLGEDWWPYGIQANRPTIEAFLRYHHEQGLTRALMRVKNVFVPQLLDT